MIKMQNMQKCKKYKKTLRRQLLVQKKMNKDKQIKYKTEK